MTLVIIFARSLTDFALEDAAEEIEEYMAEMAARVKAANGNRAT